MFTRHDTQQSAAAALESAVASARAGFVCMFSSSDEYEDALISERRAQGRYGRTSFLPVGLFVGLTLVVAGVTVLLA
jgi:hypothetical protein